MPYLGILRWPQWPLCSYSPALFLHEATYGYSLKLLLLSKLTHQDVDGGQNSIYEINYESCGTDNPRSNAFMAKLSLLDSEEKAKRRLDMLQNRRWKIVNRKKLNRVTGQPVGYVIGIKKLFFRI